MDRTDAPPDVSTPVAGGPSLADLQELTEIRRREHRRDVAQMVALVVVIAGASVAAFVLGGLSVAGRTTQLGEVCMTLSLVTLPVALFAFWRVAKRLWVAGDRSA